MNNNEITSKNLLLKYSYMHYLICEVINVNIINAFKDNAEYNDWFLYDFLKNYEYDIYKENICEYKSLQNFIVIYSKKIERFKDFIKRYFILSFFALYPYYIYNMLKFNILTYFYIIKWFINRFLFGKRSKYKFGIYLYNYLVFNIVYILTIIILSLLLFSPIIIFLIGRFLCEKVPQFFNFLCTDIFNSISLFIADSVKSIFNINIKPVLDFINIKKIILFIIGFIICGWVCVGIVYGCLQVKMHKWIVYYTKLKDKFLK